LVSREWSRFLTIVNTSLFVPVIEDIKTALGRRLKRYGGYNNIILTLPSRGI
jgi:hypothetical protein